FGKLDVARKLFDIMPVRDYISWNAIIGSYASWGLLEEAEWLFRRMQKEDGIEMNVITLEPLC
ncbi:pentatricopeptide repeat-containing protein, partial [Trifolium medium]|nr:pentatricopeptide repeat-containing protein [Trifolium medium]